MNASEHKQFVDDVQGGRVIVGVDRVFARKLYTSVPMDTMERTIGEVPYFEKGVVCCALFASPVALIASIVLFALGLTWWAFLIAPVAASLWLANRARSASAGAGIWIVTFVLVAAVAEPFVGVIHNSWFSAGIVSFVLASWCDRLIYVASAHFLRAQVLRNERALEVYSDGLVIRHVA